MPLRSRLWLTAIFFTWMGYVGFAQSHWSDEYLRSAFYHPEVLADSSILAQLSDEKIRSPWISEIDFRLRSNELSPSLDEYRLRLDLVNPALRKADKDFQQAFTNYQKIRSKLRLNSLLKNKYDLLLLHYRYSAELSILTEYREKINAYLINSESLAVKDALKWDEELFDLTLDAHSLTQRRDQLAFEFHRRSDLENRSLNWPSDVLKDISVVKNEMEELLAVSLLETEVILAREERDKQELNRDLKSNRGNIGFIQPEYEIDPENSISENLGFQVGIQIPIVNEDRVDEMYDRLESEAKLSGSNADKEKLDLLISQLANTISASTENHLFLKQKKAQLHQVLEEWTGTDIDELLELIQYVYKVDQLELKSRHEIYELYMQVLALTGYLAQPPFQNYLLK